MDVRVRAEREADRERTFAVVEAAFGRRLEAELVDALRRDAHPQLSLVAERDGEVVGHVFFSPARIEVPEPSPAVAQLAPVAVVPAHQRRGIGGALVREGLSRCRALGWSAVFLVGDPAYYARFGFALAGPRGFSYPGPHDPYLQVVELEAGALADARGRVRVHPAFEEVGAE